MSAFDPRSPELHFFIPSHRRTLADAARLERDVLIILRDVFPEANSWIATGEPRKPVAVDIDDEAGFIDMIIKLRRTRAKSKFDDPASKFYTAESIPYPYTTMNDYFTPNPRKPVSPLWDQEISWRTSFVLGGPPVGYDTVEIRFPYAIGENPGDVPSIRNLMERLILRLEPESARYAIINFDQAYWKYKNRIGWITWFSQPSLVARLEQDPRTRNFHGGAMLQLSDNPADMMNAKFVKQSFEFSRTLLPYWPPHLDDEASHLL